ncbi:hypothetical protein [Prochlorococcus sp. MIT 1341]|uniref:hypothetical protein n=1 Tax=Prochlorococcus sp. MIT 1341 TaxID=3096221 RepID=UPI002A74EEA3|nr:hypothetical protein [Prochlorococcus sp. MIT 1341]
MINFPKYNVDETGMALPKGGIKKEALDVRAYTESQLYSPYNPYLDDKQKNICEIWYTLPTVTFILSFLLFSIYPVGIKPVFTSIYISLLLGFLMTIVNKEMISKLIPVHYFLFANPFFILGLIGWAILSGSISWISGFGLGIMFFTGLFTPGHTVSNNWARSKYPRLNSRYGAAKELFKIEFPFEKYLPQSKTLLIEDLASARGSQVLAWVSLFLVVFTSVVWGAT